MITETGPLRPAVDGGANWVWCKETKVRQKKLAPRNGQKLARDSVAKAKSRARASNLAVGSRLKVFRKQAGLSQRKLAKRAGVTPATISLIEDEHHAPSLDSLLKILTAFPISIADFFALPTSRRNVLFHGADSFAVVTRGAADPRVLGGERRDQKLELFIERYQPGAMVGAIAGEESIAHDGETAAIVIQGVVEVLLAGEVRRIRAGGGYRLFGNQPYRLRNIGKRVAVVARACTPA